MSKGWSLIRFWLLASRHLLKYLHNVHSDTLESIILMFYRYGARAEPHAYKLYQRNTNFFDYVLIPQKPTKFYSFPKFSSTPPILPVAKFILEQNLKFQYRIKILRFFVRTHKNFWFRKATFKERRRSGIEQPSSRVLAPDSRELLVKYLPWVMLARTDLLILSIRYVSRTRNCEKYNFPSTFIFSFLLFLFFCISSSQQNTETHRVSFKFYF